MRIVVVSDTHMPNRGRGLPAPLKMELNNADLIIHGGDWNSIEVFEMLKGYAKVEGVYGNTDNQEIRSLFPRKQVLKAGKFLIGVVHGDGKNKTTEKRVLDEFEDKPDIIIFGHSHIPYLRFDQGTLLFNPGSATDKRKQPYYSFGILEIEDEIKSKHVFYSNKNE
ncbi:metallophosphoesterase family protein [Rossellomorea vietnamensis]|uniref:Phosphoesterase n=1 Tax=Rossellomorea vietnamensis TaxID=218284 RepID=A0A5D4NY10_9BACI|nr:metallophosphoesterase family protein [Rossellomorea vietnamensis]TYS18780.1 metallophosphoesterase family protein [Rossellomorea vietnamensis]